MNGMIGRSRGRFAMVALVAATASVLAGSATQIARADISAGDRGVFVPIVPCRLVDTRPAPNTVGPSSNPLKGGEPFTQTVRGTNGNCTVPLDATGVAMNVTISVPSAPGFLTIYPADAARPLASNLNWLPLDPPTPNKVDVKLSADGKITFYNSAGFVDIIADVVGYYANHNHDDRYYAKEQTYTRAEVDAAVAAAIATRVPLPTGTRSLHIPAANFAGDSANLSHDYDFGQLASSSVTVVCAAAGVTLPAGVTITSIVGRVSDTSAGLDASISLLRDPAGPSLPATLAQVSSTGSTGAQTITDNTVTAPVVDGTAGYHVRACVGSSLFVNEVIVNYTY